MYQQRTKAARLSGQIPTIMLPAFICTLSNIALGLSFGIYFDTEFNEYQVRSSNNTILFRAESEALARYGIRTYHIADYCGSKITE